MSGPKYEKWRGLVFVYLQEALGAYLGIYVRKVVLEGMLCYVSVCARDFCMCIKISITQRIIREEISKYV